ncbi:MAG: hypothetical protein AAFY16_02105 [Cyanobacteria bacterium J06642_3]
MDIFLLFTQHFDRDQGLDWGRLSINSLVQGTTHIWKATSSHSTKQYAESFHECGGMLPPQYRVRHPDNSAKTLPFYTVNTNPIPLDHVKGVSGNFYQISPHKVITDKGGVRSDFGIHKDANVPGSLGCPVMSSDRFEQFEQAMAKLRRLGELYLPLFVQYS